MKYWRIFILLIKHLRIMTLATEAPFDFEFSYEPGEPATRNYPGSNPEVRITTVRLNGVEIPLAAITTAMYEQMVDQVIENYD